LRCLPLPFGRGTYQDGVAEICRQLDRVCVAIEGRDEPAMWPAVAEAIGDVSEVSDFYHVLTYPLFFALADSEHMSQITYFTDFTYRAPCSSNSFSAAIIRSRTDKSALA
jgi:hypothetical protein